LVKTFKTTLTINYYTDTQCYTMATVLHSIISPENTLHNHITVERLFSLCNYTAVHSGTTECLRRLRFTSADSSSIVAGPGAGPDAPEIAERLANIIVLNTCMHSFTCTRNITHRHT